MSDHWEFFPCQMGDDVAFIFYDHGIRDSIDAFPSSTRIRIELSYKAPAANGLPTEQEFDAAKAIEDEITAYIERNSGAYVGRITVAGRRYYYCYVGLPAGHIEGFLEGLRQRYGYDLSVTVEEDPKKAGYWNDLYPTEDDWQMIQDSKVVEAVRGHGDPIEVPRRLDHWAYFASEADAARFAARVKSDGFESERTDPPDSYSTEHSVQFFRTDLPELHGINRITFQLRAVAKECNGKYDGWETSVEKGDA